MRGVFPIWDANNTLLPSFTIWPCRLVRLGYRAFNPETPVQIRSGLILRGNAVRPLLPTRKAREGMLPSYF